MPFSERDNSEEKRIAVQRAEGNSTDCLNPPRSEQDSNSFVGVQIGNERGGMGEECLENVLKAFKIEVIVKYIKYLFLLSIPDVSAELDLEREPTESAVGESPAGLETGLYTHPGWCIICIIYKN